MLSIETVNGMGRDEFVSATGHLFENSPWIAERVWSQRPFADLDSMHAAMLGVVHAASDDEKVSLLRAHPELAGKAARAGDMTEDSVSEQGGAGLNRLSEDEFARFDKLNTAYREKFDFPFIVAVRGRNKADILNAFDRRLGDDRAVEVETAIGEISAISGMRLDRMRQP